MKVFSRFTIKYNAAIVGFISIGLFILVELVADLFLGSRYPGYDWKIQSISYLGQSGSPLLGLVRIWGILFTVLLLVYSVSLFLIYRGRRGAKIGFVLLLSYALGEGVGSAFFPINAPGTPFDLNAFFHDVFSSTGDFALMLFPFFLMVYYRMEYSWKFFLYLWTVVFIGLGMGLLFSIAKYYQPNNFILAYKGIWQRIFTLNYHLMLFMIGFGRLAKYRLESD